MNKYRIMPLVLLHPVNTIYRREFSQITTTGYAVRRYSIKNSMVRGSSLKFRPDCAAPKLHSGIVLGAGRSSRPEEPLSFRSSGPSPLDLTLFQGGSEYGMRASPFMTDCDDHAHPNALRLTT